MNAKDIVGLVTRAWGHLPVTVRIVSEQTIEMNLEPLAQLHWKTRPFEVSKLKNWLKPLELNWEHSVVQFNVPTHYAKLNEALELIRFWSENIEKENLKEKSFWAKTDQIHPGGFDDQQDSDSKHLLSELYQDNFIVAEKKPFVVDLEKSKGMSLVSTDHEPKTFLDGASQIASLPIGYNHPAKQSMKLRPEIFSQNLDLTNWDLSEAFRKFLKEESGLPYVYFVNSGSEAVETAFRGCQKTYPDRKKIISFQSSFHGRSLLSLHATYNPAKRLPFEIYPGLAEFFEFPEDKVPHETKEEPEHWLTYWNGSASSSLSESWKAENNKLLLKEIEVLENIRSSLEKSPALAVLIEPMQCEGGDKYGTARFFRALRVLTRRFDTPLIFDEVQTGLGLGGPFFWHSLFNLQKLDETKDFPDCVVLAKKSQVGVCLSQFEQEIPLETAAASIMRGLIHSQQIRENDSDELSKQTTEYLKLLQDVVGEQWIQYPRNQGLCFAFDVPKGPLLMELIKRRFPKGILFYPAGENTARFRLLIDTTAEELAYLFHSIFHIFLQAKEDGLLEADFDEKTWLEKAPSIFKEIASEPPGIHRSLPWIPDWIPTEERQISAISGTQWHDVFQMFIRSYPEIIRSEWNKKISLNELNQMSSSDLWKLYEENELFTCFDLMWFCSRRFGLTVERLTAQRAVELIDASQTLENELYEPARRDNTHVFAEQADDPRTVYLAAFQKEELVGSCLATPIEFYQKVKMVNEDPLKQDPDTYYSAALSVKSSEHRNKIGLRLKVEQTIALLAQNAKVIRSRNRIPEAKAMAKLNRKLSAAVFDLNHHDYEGDATCWYQSIELHPELKTIGINDSRKHSITNKLTLSNFVSQNYIDHLHLLRSTLPEELRHIYLTSGRAEAVDKMIKLLRNQRPEGVVALSALGDSFGTTTAAARSLGGGPLGFFQWPTVDLQNGPQLLEPMIQSIGSEKILGFFIEPKSENSGQSKTKKLLKEIIEICRRNEIPVIFQETGSSFYQYSKNHFYAAEELKPDGIIQYLGNQLGLVATHSSLFLDKPLQMISTWDGDETSLMSYVNRILELE